MPSLSVPSRWRTAGVVAPGLGLRNPDGKLTGFDVDVATYVAGQLGYSPDKIEWKEAPSAQRENLIQNGQVSFIVTTDEVTLAGYAAQSPGAFKIVGQPFSQERYGIGLKKDDAAMRTKINDALKKMEDSGAWKQAFDKNLGPAGITAAGQLIREDAGPWRSSPSTAARSSPPSGRRSS